MRRRKRTEPPKPPRGFRAIPGFPGYAVNRKGDLLSCRRANKNGLFPFWSTWRPRKWVLATWKDPKRNRVQYLSVRLRGPDGQMHQQRAHTVVLLAYKGPCPPGLEGCHNDGDTMNNCVRNLRWDTRGANQRDRYAHGRGNFGERAGGARLTARRVQLIRASKLTPLALSRKYKVHRNTIYLVLSRHTWDHVR